MQSAIQKLVQELHLAPPGPYTQDWEYEVSDPARLDEFLHYYETSLLTQDEKILLMEILLDSYNTYIQNHGPQKGYAERILRYLHAERSLFDETLKYWACKELDLKNSFAITPLIRQFLQSDE